MSQFNKVRLGLVAEQRTEVDSTNTELLRRMGGPNPPPAGFLLVAGHQSQGKGQGDNRWISRPGQNWMGSLALYPTHLAADEGFRLSQVCALAVADTVRQITGRGIPAAATPAEVQKISIKWPNDVLVDGKKVAGILIQTGIQGKQLSWAILGIGIIVNQMDFPPNLARPATSLARINGRAIDLNSVQTQLLDRLQFYYEYTRPGLAAQLDQDYQKQLFQRNLMATYRDLRTGQTFVGALRGTDEQGRLLLDGPQGRLTAYDPKTIAFL